jgi:Rab11 family-interacting protein 1/2/5
MHVTGRKKKDKGENDSDSYTGSFSSLGTPSLGIKQRNSSFRNEGNADPGVISEDEDEFAFDNLSHKSSGSSLNVRHKSNNLILTKAQDDSRNSSTLPPTKPKRNQNETPTKETKVDEWEAKLYGGKNHEIGSTDSLKRRSWDRVPLNAEQEPVKELEATIEEQSMERISLDASVTAPASPSMNEKPLPLPRAATAAEPIVSMNLMNDDDIMMKPNMSPTSVKSEKHEKENIFSKKWKNFRKEMTPGKQEKNDEAIKNQYNRSSGGERIIIGGDAFNSQPYIEKSTIQLPKEVMAKYDGKSKEVNLLLSFTLRARGEKFC